MGAPLRKWVSAADEADAVSTVSRALRVPKWEKLHGTIHTVPSACTPAARADGLGSQNPDWPPVIPWQPGPQQS